MRKYLTLLLFTAVMLQLSGQSEPSTYFNIFVPPNNEPIQRNVALIVTATSDSTFFSITDDDMDGDDDDSVSGMLMAGQSYILYIKDNGINDDARYASGGVRSSNGDYYIINANKLVYASMSTDSDWQHDFVPSVNKKSVGNKFYLYSPRTPGSPRDINVFAFENNTTVTVYKISTVPTTQTGYTNIDLLNKQVIIQKTINPGEDLIYFNTEGRDVMENGATYLIESNKDVSVMYGALWGNARDGGAYVPSSNGSGSGELFYFTVPYQVAGEQEIRIVSWDDNNQVDLSVYNNGNWDNVSSWNLDEMEPGDWVGRQNGNATHAAVFRVTCTPNKRVSVMEANWMETGSTHTSDMSTMLSSEYGTSSGIRFLAYMLPPSRQNNIVNPFTNQTFQGSITHFYLFAGNKNTTVTVKDAKTNGQILSKTYNIQAGRYSDAFFTTSEWHSIYNGNGDPNSGTDRPYVVIEATENIAVLSTNFNDNWMNYFGSSLPQSFVQTGSVSQSESNPGEEVTLNSEIVLNSNQNLENTEIEVRIGSGLIPTSSTLKNNGNTVSNGVITQDTSGAKAAFPSVGTVSPNDYYEVETKVIVSPVDNQGKPIPDGTVIGVETVVSGTIDNEFQQSINSKGIKNNSSNMQNLTYSMCELGVIAESVNDSWNAAWVDYDGDGWEDLFVATKNKSQKNELYKNNGDGSFTRIVNHPLVNQKANTVASVWADINNNGRLDVLLVNATQDKSNLLLNQGQGNFSVLNRSGIDIHPQYFHGAAFADFNNDGYVDLIITNFFETRFHQLYKNNGDNTFTLVTNTPVSTVSERAMAPILGDFDNDGLVDIFIPNGNNKANSLFRNIGNFQFEKVNDSILDNDKKNSVGAAWGDFNNDGYLDLIVLNASNQQNDLYINNGDRSFQKVENSPVVLDGGDSHGAVWVDVNNNGWLDLYVTNDQGASYLYINDQNGNFTRKVGELVGGNIGNTYGVSMADYNKDGYMDLAVSTHTNGNNFLFCHNTDTANWIGFQLQGEFSNRMALGARVGIKSNGVWQWRQNLPVNGFGGQNSRLIHFGLGESGMPDSIVVIWPSGITQLISHSHINQYNMVLEIAGNVVHANVFHDENGNGIKDSGEVYVPNVRFSVNESLRVSSDENGVFSFRTAENDIVFGITQPHWGLDTAYKMHTVNLLSDTTFVNLPLQALVVGYDLNLNVSTTAWRRGFTNETTVQVQNLGTIRAENASVQLEYPQEGYLKSSSIPAVNPSPKVYEWSIGKINPGEIISILITDSIGLDATTGETLDFKGVTFSSENADLDTNNNRVNDQIEVVGAIDPNDILVSPRGDGSQGFIDKNQWLTYTVRFENVGTFKATYVFLENQIPSNLDLNTFEIISSSHDFTYKLSSDGFLRVSYIHIDLPAAIDDSIGAHGYFTYKVRPVNGISEGARIENNALIFFDFEDPIKTNTVRNTIKNDGRNKVKSLTLYPNPANNYVNIAIDMNHYSMTEPQVIEKWSVVDYTGKLVMSGEGELRPSIKLDVSRLKYGVYVVWVFDENGQAYTGKLVK